MTQSIKDMDVTEFVLANDRLVHSVCQRFKNMLDNIKHVTGAEYEDLYQIGLIGLLKAKDKFNPDYGLQLSTYAYPMILGEIMRFLRDNNLIKTSRWIKDLHYKMRKLDLSEEDVHVIAKALDINLEKAKIVKHYNPSYKSIHETVFHDVGNESITLEDTLQDDGFEDTKINELIIQQFLNTLSDREKEMWVMYNVHEFTQRQVAESFGISQVQVSRILSKIEKTASNYGKRMGYYRN